MEGVRPPCCSPAQAWSLLCVPRRGGPWSGGECSCLPVCLSVCTPEPLRASGDWAGSSSGGVGETGQPLHPAGTPEARLGPSPQPRGNLVGPCQCSHGSLRPRPPEVPGAVSSPALSSPPQDFRNRGGAERSPGQPCLQAACRPARRKQGPRKTLDRSRRGQGQGARSPRGAQPAGQGGALAGARAPASHMAPYRHAAWREVGGGWEAGFGSGSPGAWLQPMAHTPSIYGAAPLSSGL